MGDEVAEVVGIATCILYLSKPIFFRSSLKRCYGCLKMLLTYMTKPYTLMFTLASKASLILLCFLLNTVTTNAQTGVLDVTFGNKGKVITSLNDSGSVANAVAIQADRKIVVVGSS